MITTRKIMRTMRAVTPRWMAPILAVAIAIPGPQDEALVCLVCLILVLVRFPRARSAWRGGKTRRAHVVRMAELRTVHASILTRAGLPVPAYL